MILLNDAFFYLVSYAVTMSIPPFGLNELGAYHCFFEIFSIAVQTARTFLYAVKKMTGKLYTPLIVPEPLLLCRDQTNLMSLEYQSISYVHYQIKQCNMLT